jgi:hypothetical protein
MLDRPKMTPLANVTWVQKLVPQTKNHCASQIHLRQQSFQQGLMQIKREMPPRDLNIDYQMHIVAN